ncbi:hypothetical protein QYM36_016531 [Artemia franciscana]|uniref:protein-histidine N-methyltransferase n=1 Tax=Artemia franciscana TaxID=6661 RepID=A0AA88L3I9_ARTSF|nr:hypothetical protein QYM36_016531 [Artemia franciscana]
MFFSFLEENQNKTILSSESKETEVPFLEVEAESCQENEGGSNCYNQVVLNKSSLKYLPGQDIVESLRFKNPDVYDIIEGNQSDLVNGIYEGGFKVWECTLDLLLFLEKCGDLKNSSQVLDLGCGAGLLGIFALSKGCSIYFQDYNIDVLQLWTVPNVKLNMPSSLNKCRYFSGSWKDFSERMCEEKQKFDVILTSETIYNPSYYGSLVDCIKNTMKEDGVTYPFDECSVKSQNTFLFSVCGTLICNCKDGFLFFHRLYLY